MGMADGNVCVKKWGGRAVANVTKDSLFLWLGGGLIGIFILAQILQHPRQIFLKLVKSAVLGCLFILAVNWVGQYFHYHLPFNAVTALTAGFLGLPGVAALVTLHLWLFPS